jgi:hypothetical protein
MRIRVSDVLDLLANGLTPEQILDELRDLEYSDIRACLQFASRRVAQWHLAGCNLQLVIRLLSQLCSSLQNHASQSFELSESLVERHQFNIGSDGEGGEVGIGPNVRAEFARLLRHKRYAGQ